MKKIVALGVVATCIGCVEYDKFTELEDTGHPIEVEDCYEMLGADVNATPGYGWGSTSACYMYSLPIPSSGPFGIADPIDLGAARIDAISYVGSGTSVFPDTNYLRLVAIQLPGGYPDTSNNLVSADTTATGSMGAWSATNDSSSLGNLNSCHPQCHLAAFFVEIQDGTRAASDTCDDYMDVEICLEFEFDNAKRRTSANSTCADGAGRFQLIPYRVFDRDDDNDVAVIMKAVQISGTGAPTGSAWINSIEIVEDQGKLLRVVKHDKRYGFNSGDALISPDVVSFPLPNTTHTFLNGVLPMGTPFVLSEVDGETEVDFQVDLEWECATPLSGEELTPVLGYSASLDDLGCAGNWPQELTIRPKPTVSPTVLKVELYGQLQDAVTIPLSSVPAGYAFEYRKGKLEVEGILTAYDTDDATVQLTTAEYDGQTVCTAATYTLDAED